MLQYVFQRLIALVIIAFAATLVIFVALSLVPGDPAILILGSDATPETVEALRHDLGLDLPLWQQYLAFLKDLIRGDLGNSYQRGVPVIKRIAEAYPITVLISTLAIIIASIVGIGLGVLAAANRNTWIDSFLRVVLLTTTSVPVFWLGLLLIYLFAVELSWLPSFGWGTPKHIVLPTLTLATYPLATIGRITRASMIEALSQDYIRTARAKGLSERAVLLRHAFSNALVGVITVIGLQFGIMLAGAVLTETVFSVPGMGRLLINAIFARDFALIRGVVLVGVLTIVTLNFVVDVLYLAVDPRIRFR